MEGVNVSDKGMKTLLSLVSAEYTSDTQSQ
jgi:hypothetical protein